MVVGSLRYMNGLVLPLDARTAERGSGEVVSSDDDDELRRQLDRTKLTAPIKKSQRCPVGLVRY